MIDHKCECGAHYRLQDEISGQSVQCYKCGRISAVAAAEPMQSEPVQTEETPASQSPSPELTPAQDLSAESEPVEMPSEQISSHSKTEGSFYRIAEFFKTKPAIAGLGIAFPVVLICALGVIFLKSPNLLKKLNPFGNMKQIKTIQAKSAMPQNSQTPVPAGAEQAVQPKSKVNSKSSTAVTAKTAPVPVASAKAQPAGIAETKPVVKKPPKPPAPPRVRVVTSDGSPFSGILIDKDDVLITLKSGDGETINLPIDELDSINGRDPRAFLKNFTPVKDQNPVQ